MLIIFDLDGVLIESKMMHYQTLNCALREIDEKYVIEYSDHLLHYNGLSTKRKLELLTINKNLPTRHYEDIQKEKQRLTIEWLKELPVNQSLIEVFYYLKQQNHKIAVASNSIRNSVKTALLSLDLLPFVDYWVSNEDVQRPKPFPEMYWKCMTYLNSLPTETIILEDSPVGIQGAVDSGGHLLIVDGPSNITIDLIQNLIDKV